MTYFCPKDKSALSQHYIAEQGTLRVNLAPDRIELITIHIINSKKGKMMKFPLCLVN
jgi:hypothetical protein